MENVCFPQIICCPECRFWPTLDRVISLWALLHDHFGCMTSLGRVLMDGMPVGPAELMKRSQHLYGLLQEPIYAVMSCTCPPLFMKGGQKSCHGGQWTQVHLTLIRASPRLEVFVYTVCGGKRLRERERLHEGREDIKWILVALLQGQMHFQSKCAFNIGETFRANILKVFIEDSLSYSGYLLLSTLGPNRND